MNSVERGQPPPEIVARFHRPLLILTQAIICVISVVAAFVLRFDAAVPAIYRPHLRFALLVWPVTKLLVFWAGGLGRGWWRYVSLPDLIRLTVGNFAASILVTAITLAFAPLPAFPRMIYVIDLLVSLSCSPQRRGLAGGSTGSFPKPATAASPTAAPSFTARATPALTFSGRFVRTPVCHTKSLACWTTTSSSTAPPFTVSR